MHSAFHPKDTYHWSRAFLVSGQAQQGFSFFSDDSSVLSPSRTFALDTCDIVNDRTHAMRFNNRP